MASNSRFMYDNVAPLFWKLDSLYDNSDPLPLRFNMLIHGFESFQNPIIILYTEDQQDSWTFTSHLGVVEAFVYCLSTWVQSQLQKRMIL